VRDPSISTSTSGVTMLPLLLCHWVISQMSMCQVREDLLCSRLEGHSHTVMAPSYCHGTTSFLSFPIFVCPPPHLHHLLTPSALVCLPSTTSAPTPRCTCATMLCLCLD